LSQPYRVHEFPKKDEAIPPFAATPQALLRKVGIYFPVI
jgi:hypothetical protein